MPSTIIAFDRLQENVAAETVRAAIDRFRGATPAELRAFHTELGAKLTVYEAHYFSKGATRLEQYESLHQLIGWYAIGELLVGLAIEEPGYRA
jgi:hypothetical protein